MGLRFVGYRPDPVGNVSNEPPGILPKCTRSLNSDWDELVRSGDDNILLFLPCFSHASNCTSLTSGMLDIGSSVGIWACEVPYQRTTRLPWGYGDPVRTFAITPSGRLPSLLKRPEGSSMEGILAEAKDICTMLLTAAWRKWRPALFTQLRPCKPNSSTSA